MLGLGRWGWAPEVLSGLLSAAGCLGSSYGLLGAVWAAVASCRLWGWREQWASDRTPQAGCRSRPQ